MLAYLIILLDPEPSRLIGIEEPENFLHPRLLPELAEEAPGRRGADPAFGDDPFPLFPERPAARGGQGFVSG